MFTPGRVAITLIAILVAVILYWVTKILSVTTMALVEVNFTNWPTWGQLTFQAFPVLALIFLFVWAFRQLNPERDLGGDQPMNYPGKAFGLIKSTQFGSMPKMGKKSMKMEPPIETPTLGFEKSQWSSNPLAGKFTISSGKKKKKKGNKDAFDF